MSNQKQAYATKLDTSKITPQKITVSVKYDGYSVQEVTEYYPVQSGGQTVWIDVG